MRRAERQGHSPSSCGQAEVSACDTLTAAHPPGMQSRRKTPGEEGYGAGLASTSAKLQWFRRPSPDALMAEGLDPECIAHQSLDMSKNFRLKCYSDQVVMNYQNLSNMSLTLLNERF